MAIPLYMRKPSLFLFLFLFIHLVIYVFIFLFIYIFCVRMLISEFELHILLKLQIYAHR